MELSSMLHASLDGREVWGRMDICIYMAESFHCSPEIITTLLTGYTPIQNKVFKVTKKKKKNQRHIKKADILSIIMWQLWKSDSLFSQGLFLLVVHFSSDFSELIF